MAFSESSQDGRSSIYTIFSMVVYRTDYRASLTADFSKHVCHVIEFVCKKMAVREHPAGLSGKLSTTSVEKSGSSYIL